MQKSPPVPRRRLRRVVLWLLPLFVVVGLWRLHDRYEAHAALDQAAQWLVEGDHEAAAQRLEPWLDHSSIGPQARAGHRIARAFHDDRATAGSHNLPADGDTLLFDLPLIIRAAFERAEFGTVLRLTELAEAMGRPTIPLVTVAAQIETGKQPSVSAASGLETMDGARGLLAQRVQHHLDHGDHGLAIRDRQGRPIGRWVDGELEIGDGVRPEWVPKTVGRFASHYADSGSVRTSLDLELAEVAYDSFGRYRGSIVMVDPLTGEILAAVSDRRSHRRADGTPSFEQAREPASIAKLITTAAYLRHGLDPDRTFRRMACRGHEYYDGTPLYCPVIAGRLNNLNRAMGISCNVAFANLAREIGRSRVLEEFRRFGFDRSLGPFRGGRILEARGNERQLADLSIGLEATEITPLHAALLAATVANDGVMPEPTLMHSKDGKLGMHPKLLPRGVDRRILDGETVDALKRSMIHVVQRGTAMRVRTRGFPVAMKTGTASDPRYGFHVNYIGFGPLPEARVAFCVRITNQGTSRRVRLAAAEVTGRLLRKLRTVSQRRGWQIEPARPADPAGRLVRLGERLSAEQVAELEGRGRLRR